MRHQFGNPRRRTRGEAWPLRPAVPLCRCRPLERFRRNALFRFVPARSFSPGGLGIHRRTDRLHPRRLRVRDADVRVRVLPAPPRRPAAAAPRRHRAGRRLRHRPLLRTGPQPHRGRGRDRRRRRIARHARRRRRPRGRARVATTSSSCRSPIEEAELPVVADHALFCATHDVLQSGDALDNVLGPRPRRRHGGRDGRQVGATVGDRPQRGHPRAARAVRARLRRLRPPLGGAPRTAAEQAAGAGGRDGRWLPGVGHRAAAARPAAWRARSTAATESADDRADGTRG